MSRPPAARHEPVRESHYGESIEDAYRWLEDWQSKEAQA
jgi:hypothetical protein